MNHHDQSALFYLFNLDFSDGTIQTTAFNPYSGGTGISISGNTISNTAPDQTVILNSGAGINITGNYPNFTIGSTLAASQWTTNGSSIVYNLGDAMINGLTVGRGGGGIISNNTLGINALVSNTTGAFNTAIGDSAIFSNITGKFNSAIGYNALFNNTTGNSNTANGAGALFANLTGNYNTANGNQSLFYNTTGSDNSSAGYNALYSNTTGSDNTANGSQALYSNTTGNYNTANGYQSLSSNTTGSGNTANGFNALYLNTTGGGNTANGFNVLNSNTTGSGNAANGYQSLSSNTTGSGNTANGFNALNSNTTGNYNTANGYQSLSINTTGNYNTANGYQSLSINTTGYNNTANGNTALQNNYTGYYNTANGDIALQANTTGFFNTANGQGALALNTTGSNNTADGAGALYNNATGSYNTALGFQSGVISDGLSNTTGLGYGATPTISNQVIVGNTNVTSIGGYANWSNFSDRRIKKNIKQNVPGLAFINKLTPVTYNLDLDAADKITQPPVHKDANGKNIAPSDVELQSRKEKQQVVYTGFIAQDVEAAAKSLNYDFSGVDAAKNSKDLYKLRYAEFVVPLVQGEQELSRQNDSLTAMVTSMQSQINDLKTLVQSLISKSNTSLMSNDVSLSSASLEQNRPNPFQGATTIGYTLPQTYSSAQMIIRDNVGKTLKAINISGNGKGSLNIDAATLAAGAYNYSLLVNGMLIDTKQMLLIK